MKQRKRTILKICMAVFLVTGLTVFAFPYISDRIIKIKNEEKLSGWEESVSKNADVYPLSEPEKGDGSVDADDLKLKSPLYKAMSLYNEEIYKNGQRALYEYHAWEAAAVDLISYGFTEQITGSLTVECLGITYPIYLGATEENMLKGVTHLGETSLPIGGKNTHCVIAGHCGMIRTEMFRNLDKVKEGDIVKIKNQWEVLTYEVTDIIVADPDDYSKILIEDGKDLLTLVTCYPYPENSHRLLVRCERKK